MPAKNQESRIERLGIQALYTFTPFKILRAEAGKRYILILAPLYSFKIQRKMRESTSADRASTSGVNIIWRSKSLKTEYRYDRKKVVHPYELYPTSFQRDSSNTFIFVRRDLERDESWRYHPVYMEFSWNSLSSGYYCRLGYVLLASKQDCPVRSQCRAFRRSHRSSCIYYSGPASYSSLYNVYPRVLKMFDDPEDEDAFKPLLAVRYNNAPLAVVRFTDRGSFLAFIDGVVFFPKRQDIYVQPVVFLEEGLGFNITNVNALELEFIPKTLREFIKDIFLSNKDAASWIILKYSLYINKSIRGPHERILERRGFKAFQMLDKIVEDTIGGTHSRDAARIVKDIQSGNLTDEVIEFASLLFLHTLAHVLKNTLVAKYGCGSEDIDYYIEHPWLKSAGIAPEKIRVVLFEVAIGGLGYIRNFADKIQRSLRSDALQELLEAAVEVFSRSCEERVTSKLKKLENELRAKQPTDFPKRLIDLILKIYRDSFPSTGVYPHINSIRKAIVSSLPDLSENERALLDDLLAAGPHCWDGCQLCVMLERGCRFLPFDQPFLVSERLLRASLERILEMLKKPVSTSSLKRGIRRELEAFLSAARLKVDLVSPWISKEIVKELHRHCELKRLRIRVITREDLGNKSQEESLEMLAQIAKQYPSCLQVRVLEELHAKGMLVDDLMLLHGSFNFTISGLEANIENLTVDFSLEGVKEFRENFEKLWKEAKTLT